MQFFVGLTFRPNFIHYQKIDSFRSRFDEKFSRANHNQLTLIPPFEIPQLSKNDYQNFCEEFAEGFENQLDFLDDVHLITFDALDFQAGEKHLLSLKPRLPIDLSYALEQSEELLKSYGVTNKQKLKKDPENLDGTHHIYFPLAQFDSTDELQLALQEAKTEFIFPFQLHMKELVLFERMGDDWRSAHHLFQFKESHSQFEQENFYQFQSGEKRK